AQLAEARRLDERLRSITGERDGLRARINELSKEVGRLRREGDERAAEALQEESRQLGADEKRLATEHDDVSARLREVLLVIPNLPHADVPDGASEVDNPVVRGPFVPEAFAEHQRVPHWEAGAALGILDVERAAKISGSMFTMQRGSGATLARALCQLALDRNADAFEEVRPPTLVLSSTLTATGQLPKFADEAYAIERDDLWCIPTAEVPLTSLYAGEVVDQAELPMRLMACTPSYRREAGSAGRDTRGMLRTHEFDKVEILALATPEQAPDVLDELLARAEGTIAALELPYRIIEICTGDLGQSHHRSFDIEVYAPGCDQWLEVSSVSWFSDYQARRADVRFRRRADDGTPKKGSEFVHTLNGSALAVPRVWAAIVENRREADGSIHVPAALRPYMRGIERIERIEP
ncbi:MAG: serine--tRNA ligase, partial [Ilumatobacteraceae bacterium]